jgi:hypothetical protein
MLLDYTIEKYDVTDLSKIEENAYKILIKHSYSELI